MSSSARSLAQELVSWYFTHSDIYTPHEENIPAVLREPVLAVTCSILMADSENEDGVPPPPPPAADGTTAATTAATATTTTSSTSSTTNPSPGAPGSSRRAEPEEDSKATKTGSDWRDFLAPHHHSKLEELAITSSDQNSPDQVYQRLDRRSQARVDAFLEGVILAVASEAQRKSNSNANSKSSSSSTFNSNSNLSRNSPNRGGSSSNLSSTDALSIPDPRGAFRRNNSSDRLSLSLIDGLAGFRGMEKGTTTLLRSISNVGPSNSIRITKKPQISERDLLTRLELYIRSLYRVVAQGHQHCVVAAEPPRAMRARTHGLVTAFVETVGTVLQQGPVLTRLLETVTRELLAVPTLSDDLMRTIRRVVTTYEHTTSFASLAFLSSPEHAADQKLTPLVWQYLGELRHGWRNYVADCELEYTLASALDPVLRRTFKNAEFRSIGHLLEVCQDFRQELHNIQLPPNPTTLSTTMTSRTGTNKNNNKSNNNNNIQHTHKMDTAAMHQALRDLQREVLTVNGQVLPPVTYSSRKDLVALLQQTLNARHNRRHRSSRRSRRAKNTAGTVRGVARSTSSSSSLEDYMITTNTHNNHMNNNNTALSSDPASQLVTPDSPAVSVLSSKSVRSSTSSTTSHGSNGSHKSSGSSTSRRKNSSSSSINAGAPAGSFELSAVDWLTQRLLLAASRTGQGGDAYFVVLDLFGGDSVEVVPSRSLPTHGRATQPGSLEIVTSRLSSVSLHCHASFDVYPKALVGECEPLIQIHTTTTETIELQEVRVADAGADVGVGANASVSASADTASADSVSGLDTDTDASASTTTTPLHRKKASATVVKERFSERAGWRTLTIRPALYERVGSWNTPS